MALDEISKFRPRQLRPQGKRSLQLLEKDLLLFEPSAHFVDDLAGEEAELEQDLVLLPFADANEDRDEQSEEQDYRYPYRQCTAAPQITRFSGDDEHERQHDEDAERVTDPPRSPIARQVGQFDDTEQQKAAHGQGRAGYAERRRQQQEARQVAAIVQGSWRANCAPQDRAANRRLQRRRPGDGNCPTQPSYADDVGGRIAGPDIERERAEERPGQSRRTADQHSGNGYTCWRKDW